MGSVGFGEIVLIAIVALLVFGPDRLPELSRKAGEVLTKAREMTRSFTDSLDNEFDEASSPIRTLQSEFHATKDELTSAAGTILNFDVSTAPESASGETQQADHDDVDDSTPEDPDSRPVAPPDGTHPDPQDKEAE